MANKKKKKNSRNLNSSKRISQRVMLIKEPEFKYKPDDEVLSPEANARYGRMIKELEEDIKNGKAKLYNTVEEMMKDVRKGL